MDLFSLESYQFPLPEELIAQFPCTPRDSSRLLILNRAKGTMEECVFRDIVDFLNPHDKLIFNNTKVIPARLYGVRPTGGNVEILLHRVRSDGVWEAMVRPGKKLQIGAMVIFGEDFFCTIEEVLPSGLRLVRFNQVDHFSEKLKKYGQMPLPHYIKRDAQASFDDERYQTVYAENPGAVAAPTAGLHFTKEVLEKLHAKGVASDFLTLHVGLGTFKPVQVQDIREHPMHSEQVVISQRFAEYMNGSRQGREICVGTTSCRAIESTAQEDGAIQAGVYDTNIFIYPGYRFKRVDHLLTNFHLPGSTLLMLVCALGGYELVMEAYRKAVKDRFRFFSYGDAMLIV
jgi:S-adenosylmethionine:tRNA ribosyltransferase-isomerase